MTYTDFITIISFILLFVCIELYSEVKRLNKEKNFWYNHYMETIKWIKEQLIKKL